jgi:endoglycosylceramidase
VRKLLPFLALLLLDCSHASTPPTTQGAPAAKPQRFLTDAMGRARIVHGVNVDNHAKGDPGRMPDITDAEIAMLADDFGFNLVRVLIFWDAAEPSEGQWDAAYFDRVAALVDRFHAKGIDVVLDMHQDVYGPAVSGDGAPAWATRTDGQPFHQQTLWSANYFEPAVERAFDNFWGYDAKNADLQDHYVETWRRIAERFASHPGVLGYDVINEPSPGSQIDLAEILFRQAEDPGGKSETFDEGLFARFYERAIGGIRKADPDKWIFFEPRYGAPANGMRSYIPHLDDARSGDPHLAYAPHLYSAAMEANSAFDPNGDDILSLWEAARDDELAVLDCPTWIGEWGFAWGWPNAPTFGARILDMADRRMVGWTYWSWDPGTPGSWSLYDRGDATSGRPAGPTPAGVAVIRPYPRAIAGTPVSFSFEGTTKTFTLEFKDAAGVTGPTEIFVPRARVYPSGVTVTCDDTPSTCSYTWDATRKDVLLVTNASHDGVHRVTIAASGK